MYRVVFRATDFVSKVSCHKKKGRKTQIESLANESRTMIFYESPYRIVKTLEQFIEVFGDSRMVSCCREISKVYEESVRGTLAQVLAHFKETAPKGEFVIVLAGKEKEKKRKDNKRKIKHSSKYNEKLDRIMKKLLIYVSLRCL